MTSDRAPAPAPRTEASPIASPFALTPQQIAFFTTFGFLKLPGLLRADIDEITNAFEAVFEAEPEPIVLQGNEYHRVRDPRFADAPRLTIPLFVERNATLDGLRTDPRILGIASSLLGEDFEYAYSDGNLFYCDVLWHFDAFGAPIHQNHLKMYVYLDALRHDTGALRVIPGTGDLAGPYVTAIRTTFNDPDEARAALGIEADEVPSWTLEVEPGDLIVGNYRTMHATFGGGARRRLFTVNFRALLPAAS
jgi:hypothetical protein